MLISAYLTYKCVGFWCLLKQLNRNYKYILSGEKSLWTKKVFFFSVCVHRCSPCQQACLSEPTGFHHLTLTDITSEEEIKSWVCQVYPAFHSFHSSLYVYVCLLSSFSRHTRVYICWSNLPSIHPSCCSVSWFTWLFSWQLCESQIAGWHP